ncbi:hypothetical protein K470DRAFT_283716 [Piedraia hortae CBS 480.64]|uniref:Ribosomal protein bL31m N-terminal domain-containing protein n=1 Tax=Piedraia hortae CBS 480.64 TaxID=1314780 RepID=A0A6A7BRV5_9PEZI|nr:hypothetical protein K470DRAFT_283716 [Piedraia hortae CBS 480.64]
MSRPQPFSCLRCASKRQIRHASYLKRPKRPYTFTQLVTLSDGSTFLHRTTSPQPVYKSTKDTKNSALWNPSSQKLLNVEEDVAGRLKRFRQRFGRGFDAAALEQGEDTADAAQNAADQEESLMDLISGFAEPAQADKEKKEKGKK